MHAPPSSVVVIPPSPSTLDDVELAAEWEVDVELSAEWEVDVERSAEWEVDVELTVKLELEAEVELALEPPPSLLSVVSMVVFPLQPLAMAVTRKQLTRLRFID